MGHNVGREQASSKGCLGTIDNEIAEVVEKFLSSVLCRSEVEELRIAIYEGRVDVSNEKFWMSKHVHQKRDVCLNKNSHGIIKSYEIFANRNFDK